MSAADDAYQRLQAAQRAYEALGPDQRRWHEEELDRENARNAKSRLIKHKLPRSY